MNAYHTGRKLVPFLVASVVLLGLVVGAGCHDQGLPGVKVPVWNDQVVAFLESQSETSGPFLSINNPDAGSSSQFKVGEAAGGPASVVSALQGASPGAGAVFSVPIAETAYLNLSIPVYGVVYVASAGTTAAGDAMEVRVAVKQGGKIIGGEWITHNVAASNKMGAWNKVTISFRAEVAYLTAGEPLTVEVLRVSGLTDFMIGTGGTHQSFIEFRTFSSNPLSGTVYMERGKFTSSGGEQVSEDEFQARLAEFRASGGWDQAPDGYVKLPPAQSKNGASPLAFVVFGSLISLGLVLPRRRIPLRPLATVLLVFMIATSGCFGSNAKKSGPSETDDGRPQPTVNQTIEPRPELGGSGAVDGFVHDEVGIAVKGAHVAFLGTNLFGRTNAKGLFAFSNVSSGAFVLRVDADKFAPLEQEVTVEAGSVTHLNITLVYPMAKAQNDKAHLHDDWAGSDVATFADGSFTPPSQIYSVEQDLGGSWYCDGFWDRKPETLGRGGCEFMIPIKMMGRKMFPGTSSVEVTLAWPGGSNAPKEMGLRVVTALNKTDTQLLMPRAPGTPFRIAIFPNEVDPGHQKFSSWEFYAVLPVTDLYYPAGPLYYAGGAISYSVKIHKGVVPYEPAHRDFWAGGTELPLTFNNNPATASGNGCYPMKSGTSVWTLKSPSLVPPGTKEIRGTLKWAHQYLDAAAQFQTQWKVAYLTANGPHSEMAFQHAEMTANGTSNYNFKIVPKAEETDQFYVFSSNWLLSASDPGKQQASSYCSSTTNYTKWTISAVAVKDPEFKDSM